MAKVCAVGRHAPGGVRLRGASRRARRASTTLASTSGGVSLARRDGRPRRSDGGSHASALAIHLWAVCLPAPVSRVTADTPSPARARSTSPCRPRGVSRELECRNKGGSSRCNLRQVTAWRSPPLLSRHVSTTCWHTTPRRSKKTSAPLTRSLSTPKPATPRLSNTDLALAERLGRQRRGLPAYILSGVQAGRGRRAGGARLVAGGLRAHAGYRPKPELGDIHRRRRHHRGDRRGALAPFPYARTVPGGLHRKDDSLGLIDRRPAEQGLVSRAEGRLVGSEVGLVGAPPTLSVRRIGTAWLSTCHTHIHKILFAHTVYQRRQLCRRAP